MNANDIISDALKMIGVIQSGGTPTTNQYADGLTRLNDLINSWSSNASLIYEDTREELSIPVGSQEITIGPTGTLVTNRPMSIVAAQIKLGSIEYPMVTHDIKSYERFANKTSTGMPRRIYYRNTFPNGIIYFERTTEQAYTLILTSMKELTNFPDGTTDISLPNHYSRALKTNLAVEMAPEMGASQRLSHQLINMAGESKADVIGRAFDLIESQTNVQTRYRYSIEADSY